MISFSEKIVLAAQHAKQAEIYKKNSHAIITHDLSIRDLGRNLANDGMLSPSLAISKGFYEGTGFLARNTFGNVRMVMKAKNILDNENISVYDRDAYTTIIPPVSYLINEKYFMDSLQALVEDDPVGNELLKNIFTNRTTKMFDDHATDYSITQDLGAQHVVQYLYCKHRGEDTTSSDNIELFLDNRYARHDEHFPLFIDNLVANSITAKGMVLEGDFIAIGHGITFTDLIDAAMEACTGVIGAELKGGGEDMNGDVEMKCARIASTTRFPHYLDALEFESLCRISENMSSTHCEIDYAARAGGIISKGKSVTSKLLGAPGINHDNVATKLSFLIDEFKAHGENRLIQNLDLIGINDDPQLTSNIISLHKYYSSAPVPYFEIKFNGVVDFDDVAYICVRDDLTDDVKNMLEKHGIELPVVSYDPSDPVNCVHATMSGAVESISTKYYIENDLGRVPCKERSRTFA